MPFYIDAGRDRCRRGVVKIGIGCRHGVDGDRIAAARRAGDGLDGAAGAGVIGQAVAIGRRVAVDEVELVDSDRVVADLGLRHGVGVNGERRAHAADRHVAFIAVRPQTVSAAAGRVVGAIAHTSVGNAPGRGIDRASEIGGESRGRLYGKEI